MPPGPTRGTHLCAMHKVIAVCLGNICRSPLAHGLLLREAERRGLDWEVDSAGTGDYHAGAPPDSRSVAVAAAHGLDISGQRARQFAAADLAHYDAVLVMDAQNYQRTRALARTDAERDKVGLIMNYAEPGRNAQVPDPYWDDDGFEGVFQMLERAVSGYADAVGGGG